MIGVIAIGLSILVIMGGLYLLAKSKKDSLGNLYIFSSYSAIILGFLLFTGTIVGGVCMMRHHSNGNASCYMSGQGSSCGQSMGCVKGNAMCNAHQKSCRAQKQCGSGAEFNHHGNKSSYGHHGNKSSCDRHGSKAHKKGMHKNHEGDDSNDNSEEVELEEKVIQKEV